LNKSVEYRAAVDAELHDYHENVGYEDFFIISGTFDRPASGLGGKEWQEQAIRTVQTFVVELIGKEASISYVQNITGRGKDALVRYQVKVDSVQESREIRNRFGRFFAKGEDRRPEMFKSKEVSIRNRVTQETRVRIAILQVIAKRYRDSNKDSKASVISYEPRPVLRVVPPSASASGSDRRAKSYFFVDAVKSFPTNFSKKDLDFILAKVNQRSFGKLRSLFICLSDDLRRHQPEADEGAGTESSGVNESSHGGANRGSKRGHEGHSGSSREKNRRH